MDINDKKLLRNVTLIFVIAVILLVAVIVVNKVMTANAIKQKQELEKYQAWLAENCECLETNRPKCTLSGFEYNKTRDMCVNYAKKLVTYPRLACSEYDCSGEIKLWNNETDKWEDK